MEFGGRPGRRGSERLNHATEKDFLAGGGELNDFLSLARQVLRTWLRSSSFFRAAILTKHPRSWSGCSNTQPE